MIFVMTISIFFLGHSIQKIKTKNNILVAGMGVGIRFKYGSSLQEIPL
jgi:hypothetical protein